MNSSLINSITIDSLKQPFTFDGEFVVLSFADLVSVFRVQNSFKTKFYALLMVETAEGTLMIDQEVFENTRKLVLATHFSFGFHPVVKHLIGKHGYKNLL